MGLISTDKIVERLYKASKALRDMHYEYQTTYYENPIKVVSKGDSWFHFPLMPVLKDVVNHLIYLNDSPYAVKSLGHPGDDLVDYISVDAEGNMQGDIAEALADIQPQFLLLCGGGNDILRSDLGRMSRIVLPVDPNDLQRAPQDYLSEHYHQVLLPQLLGVLRRVFSHAAEHNPDCHVLVHSYAYLQPLRDSYIEKPLNALGFNKANFGDARLDKMRAVTVEIVDAYHHALEVLVAEFDHAHLVDCRGVITADDWFDEGHPSTKGCGKICELFSAKMLEILGLDTLPTLIPVEEEEGGS